MFTYLTLLLIPTHCSTYKTEDKYDILSNGSNKYSIGNIVTDEAIEISFDLVSTTKCPTDYCEYLSIGDVLSVYTIYNTSGNNTQFVVLSNDISTGGLQLPLVQINNIYETLPDFLDANYHSVYILLKFPEHIEFTFKYDTIPYENMISYSMISAMPYYNHVRKLKNRIFHLDEYPIYLSKYTNSNISTNILNNYITNITIRTGWNGENSYDWSMENHIRTNFSKFILFEEERATWQQARTFCQSVFGTDLAVIHSEDDWHEIFAVLNTKRYHGYSNYISPHQWPVWIGLNYINQSNTPNWIWVDGHYQYTTSHTKYLENEPYHPDWFGYDYNYFYEMKSASKCASLDADLLPDPFDSTLQYVLYRENCATKMPFICQALGTSVIISDPVTWNEADIYCQEQYNSTLFTTTELDTDIGRSEAMLVFCKTTLQNYCLYYPEYVEAWINSPCTAITYESGLPTKQMSCSSELPFICEKKCNCHRNYVKESCEFDNCWKQFITDGSNSMFVKWHVRSSPPVAFWNNKLYMLCADVSYFQFCETALDATNNHILQMGMDNFAWDCYSQRNTILREYINSVLDNDIMTYFQQYNSDDQLSAYLSITCYGNQCTQRENMLYIFGEINVGFRVPYDTDSDIPNNLDTFTTLATLFVIVSIDLDQQNTNFIKIHEYRLKSIGDKVTDPCIASNTTHIFLSTDQIWIYNIKKSLQQNENMTFVTRMSDTFGLWSVSNQKIPYNLTGSSCSMNWDNSYFLIFGGWNGDKYQINNQIWKYNTMHNKLSLLNILHPNPSYITKAILAHNGNIYFFDGISDYTTGLYEIFDSKTEMFQNNKFTSTKLALGEETAFGIEYVYKSYSNAVVYDDNALVRIWSKDSFGQRGPWFMSTAMEVFEIGFEYIITTNISFSFPKHNVIKNSKIWSVRDALTSIDIPNIASRSYLFSLQSSTFNPNIINITLNITTINKEKNQEECNIYDMKKNMLKSACSDGIALPLPEIKLQNSKEHSFIVDFEIELLPNKYDIILLPLSKSISVEIVVD
eukprot:493994_1